MLMAAIQPAEESPRQGATEQMAPAVSSQHIQTASQIDRQAGPGGRGAPSRANQHHPPLTHKVHCFLKQGIGSGDRPGIGLEPTLIHDQVTELGGKIHVRSLKHAAGDFPAAAGVRKADLRGP